MAPHTQSARRPEPLREGWRERGFLIGVLPVSLLHLALSLWSMTVPERMAMGDRAQSRITTALRMNGADGWLPVMLERGGPGDYAVHAFFHGLGGFRLLLAVQLLAFLATLVLLYRVGRALGLPAWACGTATTAYGLLASSLHQPHTIVTEAFFTPAVAAITAIAALSVHRRALSRGGAAGLALLSALACFVRPVFIPVLPAISVVLHRHCAARPRLLLAANAGALLPLLIWAAVQTTATGSAAGLGGEGFSLAHNLRGRMARMESMGGPPIPSPLDDGASLIDYARYAISNPGLFIRATGTDAVMYIANPGVNHTFGVFLGLFDKPEGTAYWVPLLDREGPIGLARALVRREPSRLFWNGVGFAGWLLFALISARGVYALARSSERALLIALLTLVIVLSAATFSSHAVRWSHRSPIEFAMALFFALGLDAWGRRRGAPTEG